MKQSSSITTSAHTGIEDDRSYVFMSNGLEESILGDMGVKSSAGQLGTLVNLDGDYVLAPFLSAFVDDAGNRTVVVSSTFMTERLLKSFILDEKLDIVMTGLEFKAVVVRVDSDRSYLRIQEQ